MEEYIPITHLNDFLFCPYSIYLHNVYQGAEDQAVKAAPQLSGTKAHKRKEESTPDGALMLSMPVLSEELGIYGIIDEYDPLGGVLTEYKNHINKVFEGQLVQVQSQAICLAEMEYTLKALRLADLSTGRTVPVRLPTEADRQRIKELIGRYKSWSPENRLEVNPAKCRKCIYSALCDKSDMTNDF